MLGRGIVSSGGLESAATLEGSGILEVSSGGTVDSVVFSSGGILQLDSLSPTAFGGTISKRHLLSLEGTRPIASKTLFDVLLPVAPPRPPH